MSGRLAKKQKFSFFLENSATLSASTTALDMTQEQSDGLMDKVIVLETMDVNADAVTSNLEGIPGVAEILEQYMYFGMSLARVGADFRAVLSPIFVARLRTLMKGEHWTPAAEQAEKSLASDVLDSRYDWNVEHLGSVS